MVILGTGIVVFAWFVGLGLLVMRPPSCGGRLSHDQKRKPTNQAKTTMQVPRMSSHLEESRRATGAGGSMPAHSELRAPSWAAYASVIEAGDGPDRPFRDAGDEIENLERVRLCGRRGRRRHVASVARGTVARAFGTPLI